MMPHIVLMTCHDIGRHVGCYGVETVHSPNLDRLAATGVRFDAAFTTAPSCSPSRAALATGRYPHANGVMGLAHPPFLWDLNAGERHMARLLGEAGYETHLFGHEHVTPDARRLGFQHLHGFDVEGRHEVAWGSRVTARLRDFLRQPQSGAPLFIEMNLEEPHRPYDQGGAVPDTSKGISVPAFLPDGPAAREELAALQGAIRQADAAVGTVLDLLRETGLTENLLTIFVADHGLAMPRAKCTLYDPGIEIALIIRWPAAGMAGGRAVDAMISNVDVLPTLLEAIGLPIPESVQGRSFLGALAGSASAPRETIYAEKTYHTYYDPMRAIRTSRFKLIRNFETACLVEVPGDVQGGALFRADPQRYSNTQHPPVELYDLEADPLERENLAGQEAYHDVEQELDGRLWTWMRETGDPLLGGWVPSPAARSLLGAGDLLP